jgi:O-antigen/teichoic acid export membrane protein
VGSKAQQPLQLTTRRLVAKPFQAGLARDAVGTLVLNTAAVGLGFLLALVLSRTLGAGGYGAYAFAFAWATLLSVPAVLGLTPVVVRNVAGYAAHERWGELKGILIRSNQIVLCMSLVLMATAGLLGLLFLDTESPFRRPYFVGLALIPLLALSAIRLSTLQGLGHVVLGRLPETIVAPAAFLAFVLVAAQALGADLSPVWVIGLQVLATLLAFALGVYLLRSRLPDPAARVAPLFETRIWARSAAPLLLVAGLSAVNLQVGTIIVGATTDPAEVGIYGVASRISVFTGFLAMAALYALMPVTARLHATGDTERLRVLVPRSARIVLLVSSPLALAFLAVPGFFLHFFGSEFVGGETALRILVVGEVIKLVLGSGSMVLAMTGLEDQLLRGAAAGTATNIVLLIAFVPPLGADGAAIALAASGMVTNTVFAYVAWKRAGLWTPAVSFRSRASVRA